MHRRHARQAAAPRPRLTRRGPRQSPRRPAPSVYLAMPADLLAELATDIPAVRPARRSWPPGRPAAVARRRRHRGPPRREQRRHRRARAHLPAGAGADAGAGALLGARWRDGDGQRRQERRHVARPSPTASASWWRRSSTASPPSTRTRRRWRTATPGCAGLPSTPTSSASTRPGSPSAAPAPAAAWPPGSRCWPATAARSRVASSCSMYPMLDDRNATPSSHAVVDPKVWNRQANDAGWNAYLAGRAGADDVEPYAAPARATDLAGLPPAYIDVGDLDLFLDEDIAYAQAPDARRRAGRAARLPGRVPRLEQLRVPLRRSRGGGTPTSGRRWRAPSASSADERGRRRRCSRPTPRRAKRRKLEAAGFHYACAGEHVSFNVPAGNSFISLSVAAGATTTIKLMSTIVLAPLYPPALLAKLGAALDVASAVATTSASASAVRTPPSSAPAASRCPSAAPAPTRRWRSSACCGPRTGPTSAAGSTTSTASRSPPGATRRRRSGCRAAPTPRCAAPPGSATAGCRTCTRPRCSPTR